MYPTLLLENIGRKITLLGIFLYLFKINLDKKVMAILLIVINMFLHSFLFFSNVLEGVDTLSYL